MIDLMERNREGRRGGNGSGNVSSSRRPRTFGFRDASEDESQNSRFHSKKESHGSRKRKNCRSSNGEYHLGQSEERDENYEDSTVMAASEEDDDLPPPTVGRQAGKLKIHLKNTHEEVKPIVVPRKLRTAMLKRYNESAPKSHNETRRKLNIEFAVAKATTSCSGAAPEAAQDMKLNNHKIHSDKHPKVSSSTISEQEAEVAETLFDLARMFSSQATNSETKSQSNSEMKMGPNHTMSPLSSLQHCSSPVTTRAGSPSSSHNFSALGASKRKHPDVYKSKDAGEAVGDAQFTLTAKRCLSASSLGTAAESVDAEQLTDTRPLQTEACAGPLAEPLAFSMVASVAISPSTSANASLTPTQMLQTADCSKIEEKTFQREESDNHTFIQKVPSTYNVLENKSSVTNFNDVKSDAEKDIKAVGNSVEKENPTKIEAENGLLQLPLAKSNCPGKSEIDLMAPPKPGDEINDIMNMKKLDIKEKQEVDIEGYEQKDKTINYQTSEQENQMTVKIEQDVCKYQESGKANEQTKDTSDQSNCLDRSKHDVGKESPRGSGKNVKADSRVQRGDRSASATTSMPIAVTGVTGPTLPLSMGLSGWSAGLPALGYYSPVAAAAAAAAAAAWPSSLPLAGTSPVDENIKLPLPLFLQTRQPLKRSATHVYITHFIESQQQLRKNPLWAAAFAANTYNLSIPMAPGGLLGNALGHEVRGSGLGAGTVNGRGYAMSAVAKDKSSEPYVDVVGRKSLSQQQTQTAQQQLSLFSQTGPPYLFPVTQSASTSTAGSDAGRVNVGLGEVMLSNGNSATFSSSSVQVAPVDTENGTSNKGVASAAAVQAQLLHSVIQRNVFPYSFSHQQFGPLFSGHPSPQQVAQYYSNPYFGSHLLQPLTPAQQSQSLSNLMSETTVTQKQQYSQGCNFAASGPLQQAIHNAEASSVDQISKKECVTVSGIPSAEVKAIASRSVYGQNSSSVNFPPVLAAGMGTFPAESQDISKTFVGKQESKMQQSQTQLQSQYHATLKWQPQQDIDTVNCVTSPAMNLKSPNPYASEAVSPISIVKNKGSDSLPAVTLVMASQGHSVLQTAGDSMTGLVHYQTATDKLLVSGQSYNFSISEGQKQQQQHRTQKQRLASVGIEDDKANIEECSFSNSGCKEDRKSSCKLQPNQTNIPRVDLEESLTKNASGAPSTAGSHMNMVAPSFQGAASSYYNVCAPSQQFYQGSKQKIVHYKPASSSSILTAPATLDSTMVTFSEKTHSYPPTFSKMPQQASSFLGHAVSTPNQGVRRGGTPQEHEKISQRSAAGSPGPATSGCTVPTTISSMERAPGKTPRNHQSATNVVSSRLPPDSSISSSGVTSLSPLSPVPSGAVTAKSAVSMKDSLSPKSSSGSSSGKKTSMPFQMNGTTMLGSNCLAQNVPLKPSQSQLVQNQYDIHQQHIPYPFFQQTVQSMEPVQKQSTVPQQYHLSTNQQQAVQLQKQSLTSKQNLQLRQQLFMQQNPLYFQTQSHQRLEISSQPQTTLTQHVAKQMKPQFSQQQMLGAPATSFGIATTADLPAALCMGTSGNTSLTGMSDGVALPRGTAAGSLTPAKLTTDINKSSSCFQKANGTGPTFLPSHCGPLNSVASTQQQINSNYTMSSPYSNLLSQATSIADSTQKSGDDMPATSN
ncbi:uncharacterized protein LOC131079129 isoform X2 [Cryptomeria japonica]|uniref:uncharacterized protein LOC131079129 isoform X2 n=1 Tax=Cryptomeria japonica TaxID=3369 RepID=UPI0027DA2044|nr:uncharacterized protein LOC131079129 isoform X2 [Cryptomeria japonica]